MIERAEPSRSRLPSSFTYLLIMARNWLVAVDDSIWATYAFNYTIEMMDKKADHLYLMHVMEEPTRVFVGYATANLIDSMRKLEEEKARKVLVHYGHKAKDLGVRPSLAH